MKKYLILVPILALSLLQGVFLPVNLVLLLILFWAVVRPTKEVYTIAFLSGLFLDLAIGTPLGLGSLLFLLASALVNFYSRRFDPTHPIFLPLFIFLASLIFNLILNEPWLGESIALAILAFLTRPLLKYYWPGFDRSQLKLKLE
jgi:rod shape-determining protein MreD